MVGGASDRRERRWRRSLRAAVLRWTVLLEFHRERKVRLKWEMDWQWDVPRMMYRERQSWRWMDR